MRAAIAAPGNASTILTHVFGRGLEDDRYVVERFQAMADGDIRRWPGDEPAKKGRRKAKPTIASLKAVKEMRPARTEIIVCTGLRIKGGVQMWGRHRHGPVLRSQAERLSILLRGRPAGLAPAGRPPPGFQPTAGRTPPMAYKNPDVGRARDRERFRKRTAERIAQGLCPRCGERPPAPSRSVCEPCGEKRNRAGRVRDARLRAAGKPRRDPERARHYERERSRRQNAERIARGLCAKCGQPPSYQ